MNDAEKAGKAYETYMKANMVTGLPDLLTGGALSRGVGSAVRGALGRVGLGGTKRWYSSNTGDWGARGISDVSQSAYNNYGDLRNLYNEGKAQEDWAGNGQATGQDIAVIKKGEC